MSARTYPPAFYRFGGDTEIALQVHVYELQEQLDEAAREINRLCSRMKRHGLAPYTQRAVKPTTRRSK